MSHGEAIGYAQQLPLHDTVAMIRGEKELYRCVWGGL